ncbi:O-antigen ligase family protein [Mesorhizobium sp. M1403]|uniref:O-antigen ligase family protein n=1 Tax=Mesorhizobium sp. M1403 TaxID=2957097 RepID=UPI003337F2BC
MASNEVGKSSRIGRLIVVVASGAALWFAAFARAQDFEGQLYAPMNGPLEALFSQGRTLSLGAMLLAIAVTLKSGKRLNRAAWRNASFYVAAVNLIILIKLMLYGNYSIFFQGSFAIFVQLSLFVLCTYVHEQDDIMRRSGVSYVAEALYVFSVLFILTNIYVYIYFEHSSTVLLSKRFFGITANPQHLAMSIALCTPVLLYYIVRYGVFRIAGLSSALLLSIVLFIEYLTGSRLGFLSSMICIAAASRYFLDWRRFLYLMSLGILVLPIAYVSFYASTSELIWSRFIEGRTDTRSDTWASGWDAFLQNPWFGGAPGGDPPRYGFIESTWISAAYSGGFVALGILLVFLFLVIGYLFKLNFLRGKRVVNSEYIDFYMMAIVVCVFMSFIEAAFLGVFATHTMMVYLYAAGAGSLASSSRRLLYGRHRYPIGAGRYYVGR